MAKDGKKIVASASSAFDRIMDDATRDDRNWIQKLFVEMSAKSATTQVCVGAATGWATGFMLMKVGRLAALAVGGTIILFEVAHENGIIKVDWSKVDKVTDKVEEAVSGQKKSWMDKAERYVDRKIDAVERNLKPKRWYTRLIGDETGVKFNHLHVFLVGFCGGLAIGMASA